MVVQVAPALSVSKTSSRSRNRCESFFGSTMSAWLYHACVPGVPPDSANAELEAASFLLSAISVHGPARLPLADSAASAV